MSALVSAVWPGSFTTAATDTEWCARRLLARIHSYTLNRLRKEIEPVSASDFMRFLFVWQKVSLEHRVQGPESVAAILDQLEGFDAPAGSWESEILPARVADYDPAWLDAELKRVGLSLRGCCPIHKGSNPQQFVVDLRKNVWRCFGDCDRGGGSLELVAEIEHLALRDAAALVARVVIPISRKDRL